MKVVQLEFPLQLARFPTQTRAAHPVRLPVSISDLVQRNAPDLKGIVDPGSITLLDEHDRTISTQFIPDPIPLCEQRSPVGGISVGAQPTRPCNEGMPYPLAGTLLFMHTPGRAPRKLRLRLVVEGYAFQSPAWKNHYQVLDDAGRPASSKQQTMQIRPYAPRDGKVSVYQGRALRACYHIADAKRPYIYPLNTSAGDNILTLGMYGDLYGHRHHMGLWMGNQNIDGVNFWEDQGDGVILHRGFETIENGCVMASMEEKLDWMHDEECLIQEKRTLQFYHADNEDVQFDLCMSLTPCRNLTIRRNIFGFAAIRGNPSLEPTSGGGYLLNANGKIGEAATFWDRAKWMCLFGGLAPQRRDGCAILDHPDNAQYPTCWQTRDNGFFSTAFACEEDVPLESGKALNLLYRIYMPCCDDSEVASRLDEAWSAFASTPALQWD